MSSDARLARWCERHLGSVPAERFFGADHLSEVHGLRLEDGRNVVLKVRGRQVRLLGCHAVHRAVWEAGVPCPEPLVAPQPLADDQPDRWVTAEAWVGGTERPSGSDLPDVYARLLARIVEAAPDVDAVPPLDPPVPWLWFDHGAHGRTWPPPASERWDPHRIQPTLPPVVVDVARRTRARLLADDVQGLRVVAGHGDLSGHNVRWSPPEDRGGDWRPVVHDWDSVVAAPEAVLAGAAAVDSVAEEVSRAATPEQIDRFLFAYADARGRPWTDRETEAAHAAAGWVAAYDCAFEHLKGGPYPRSEQLAVDAEERLHRAGA